MAVPAADVGSRDYRWAGALAAGAVEMEIAGVTVAFADTADIVVGVVIVAVAFGRDNEAAGVVAVGRCKCDATLDLASRRRGLCIRRDL